jgi:hypothetical protein
MLPQGPSAVASRSPKRPLSHPLRHPLRSTARASSLSLSLLHPSLPLKLANIAASLGIGPTTSEVDYANLFISTTLTLAYISFAFDFLGLLLGLTLFFPKVNLFHIITHFIGGCYISWFIADEWEYQNLLGIVMITNVSSMVVEIFMMIAIFGIKSIVY